MVFGKLSYSSTFIEDESVMIFQPNQTPEVKYDNEILPVLNVFQGGTIY
jgi:hypothetical protein